MRKILLALHRYVGLSMAVFLVLVGLTGSVIAYRWELERLLNPAMMTARGGGKPLMDAIALRERAEAIEPRAAFEFLSLSVVEGRGFLIYPRAKTDPATGAPYVLGYNELYLNPYTGGKLGARDSTKALIPFIVRLHKSMALGNPGTWVIGIVSLAWTFDCFIGFWLTLPARAARRKPGAAESGAAKPAIAGPPTVKPGAARAKSWFARWRPAWQIKLGAGRYRVNFDLHRAFGLWTWAMLFVFASSGVAFNMPRTFQSTLARMGLKARPFYGADMPALPAPLETPALGWRGALDAGRARMREEAAREGFAVGEEGYLRLDRSRGVYIYDAKTSQGLPGEQFSDYWIFVDANTGARRGAWSFRTSGSANIVTKWLFALHMGTVFGRPMQLLVFLMGFVVAALSFTGVVIWLKKRGVSALGRTGRARPSKRAGRDSVGAVAAIEDRDASAIN